MPPSTHGCPRKKGVSHEKNEVTRERANFFGQILCRNTASSRWCSLGSCEFPIFLSSQFEVKLACLCLLRRLAFGK